MGTWNWDRIAAGTGIGTVVSFIVGFFLVGDAPKLDDPAREITTYYTGERGSLVTATILFGLGAVLLIWFVSALATQLREAGQARLGATAFGGGLLVAGVLFLILVATAGAMLTAQEGGDEGAVQALNQLTWAAEVIITWPVAVLVGATAAAAFRSLVFPLWHAWAGGIAALLFLLGGTTWAKDGFWAPDGAYGTITFVLFLVWVVVTSSLLVSRAKAADAPLTAPIST